MNNTTKWSEYHRNWICRSTTAATLDTALEERAQLRHARVPMAEEMLDEVVREMERIIRAFDREEE